MMGDTQTRPPRVPKRLSRTGRARFQELRRGKVGQEKCNDCQAAEEWIKELREDAKLELMQAKAAVRRAERRIHLLEGMWGWTRTVTEVKHRASRGLLCVNMDAGK
jgi:hypothetical protein